ncbi:efflux RND transporter periplasmic adaptor subunit, partial [Nodularia sphaerocarpa CS-585A2]
MILDKKMPNKQAKLPSYNGSLNQIINPELYSISATKHRAEAANRPLSRYILFITSLLGVGLLTASCGSMPKESAKAQSQQGGEGGRGKNATPVDVAIARTGFLRVQPSYTGNTTPFRTVSVRSQVEARLLALNLDVGDTVKQGQNVGLLDDAILLTSLK